MPVDDGDVDVDDTDDEWTWAPSTYTGAHEAQARSYLGKHLEIKILYRVADQFRKMLHYLLPNKVINRPFGEPFDFLSF